MLDNLHIRHRTFTHVAPDPTLACIEEGAAEMRVGGRAGAWVGGRAGGPATHSCPQPPHLQLQCFNPSPGC